VLQDLKKEIAISRIVEQRPALIATGGDEVQMSGAVVPCGGDWALERCSTNRWVSL
jgi:hypothetical protein